MVRQCLSSNLRHLLRACGALLAISVNVPACAHAQSRVADWKLTPTVTVGDGRDDTILETVRSLQLLRDGRLLIADTKAKSIFVFDSMGRKQRPIGRDGAGPAEYSAPYALATIGDTIAVLDVGNSRIGLFNGKGEWQGQWPAQRITGPEIRLIRVGGAQFYSFSTKPDGNRLQTVFARHDVLGVRDTVVPPPLPKLNTAVVCPIPNGGISVFGSVFQPRTWQIPAAGSTLLTAGNESYRLELRKPGGELVTTFVGSATRVPLTDAEWEESIADFTAYVKKNTAGNCTPKSLDRPSAKPVFRAVFWDDAGRLWVERYLAKGFAFDVFAKNGTQLASMTAPERNPAVEPVVVGNRIALLATGDDAVPVVRVYRFAPGR